MIKLKIYKIINNVDYYLFLNYGRDKLMITYPFILGRIPSFGEEESSEFRFLILFEQSSSQEVFVWRHKSSRPRTILIEYLGEYEIDNYKREFLTFSKGHIIFSYSSRIKSFEEMCGGTNFFYKILEDLFIREHVGFKN